MVNYNAYWEKGECVYLCDNQNWLDDPIAGFDAKGGPPKDVDEFGETQAKILYLQDARFFDEVDGCMEEFVQNWNMFPWFVIMFKSFHT